MSDMVLTLFDVEGVCVGVVLYTNNLANSHVQSGDIHCNRGYETAAPVYKESFTIQTHTRRYKE